MQEMTFDQICEVSGGVTESQCIAAVSLGGGIVGAGIGFGGAGGFGAWAGFEGGALLGGMVGGLVCGSFVN